METREQAAAPGIPEQGIAPASAAADGVHETDDAPEPVAETESTSSSPPATAAATTSGLTGSGRAMNDPRVNPSPVGDVRVETARMVLFQEQPAPAVEAPSRNVPRASNDPRGPRASGEESA